MNKTLAEQYREANKIDIHSIDPEDYIAQYIGKSLHENECFLFKDASVLKITGEYSNAADVIVSSETYKLDVLENENGQKQISIKKPRKAGSSDYFQATFNGEKLKIIETKNNEDEEYILTGERMKRKFSKLALNFEAFDNAVNKLNKEPNNLVKFLSDKMEKAKDSFSSKNKNRPKP